MLDTKGPEVRVGMFAEGRAALEKGSIFALTTRETRGDSHIAQVDLWC